MRELPMSYNSIVEMAQNQSLIARIAACATMEGITNPSQWAQAKAWTLASQPGWTDSWDSGILAVASTKEQIMADYKQAVADATAAGEPRPAPPSLRDPTFRRQLDVGAREDVITDQMILSAVQAIQEPDADGRSPS
jgi:hypothetical protein